MTQTMTQDAKLRSNLPPFRKVDFAPRRVEVERREDGTIILRNPHPMGDAAPHLIAPLRRWAEEAPERTYLAERPPGPAQKGVWNRLSYKDANDKVNAIGAGLIRRGLGPDAPLMILSGNSIPHALMTYAAALAGAPAAPISEAYSLMSSDFAKLRHVFDIVRPRMMFVDDRQRFAKALDALDLTDVHIVSCTGTPEGEISYDALLDTNPGPEITEREATLTWDTVSKYLFTSGSTGMPKAVINTHGMMCVNSVMGEHLINRKPDEEPNTLISWLPWNHTFGGNAILNNTLTHGGTLYLDRGRPLPGRFDETLEALREIAPTVYASVPAGFAMLIDALEEDDALARLFFSRLRNLAYGGAALSQDIAERVQAVAMRITGERILFLSGYGATETAPTIMSVHWETPRMGLLGLPLPGVEIKLQPVNGKLDVRARGVCITPGYYKNPDRTKEAFDEEGFYCLGDAVRFVDDNAPEEGLVFDGRVAENFKLNTGVWVNAGALRVKAIEAAAGLLRDALVAGLDKAEIGILGFPDIVACRALLRKKEDARADDMPASEVLTHASVQEALREGLARYNKDNPASSTRITRALLMEEPPDLDSGEITDKGYINQSVALSRRAALVEALYAEPPGAGVVVIPR